VTEDMVKRKEVFICSNCGYQSLKWLGQCPYCSEWDTFEKVVEDKKTKKSLSKPVFLTEVEETLEERIKTNIDEVDRVLGGGVVKGEILLLAGPPGVGKSTLFLQMASSLSKNSKVLYVSCEESLIQIKLRAKRMNVKDKIYFLSTNDLMDIVNIIIKTKPDIVFIDSIQGVNSFDGSIPLGTPTQLRFSTEKLCEVGKKNNTVIFLSGHVTKEGLVAGPKILEHMVDAVFYLDIGKDSFLRTLYSHKNRFGGIDEVSFFYLGETGFKEVKDFNFFSSSRDRDVAGRSYSVIFQGRRPIVVEIEALISSATSFPPRRQAIGIEFSRLVLLLAVMERKLNINFSRSDVFIKASAGINIKDPDVDLAIVLAILSSKKNIPLSKDVIAIGEVSLTGDLRAGYFVNERIKEGLRHKFNRFYLPNMAEKEVKKVKGEIQFLNSIKEVKEIVS